METSLYCIKCFFRQAQSTAQLLRFTSKQRAKLFSFLTEKLLAFDFCQPPVVFGRIIYRALSRMSGTRDIFAKEKLRAEKQLLSNVDSLRRMITIAPDSLHQAAVLACAANAIDFGAGRVPSVNDLLSRLKKERLSVDHVRLFRQYARRAKNILIIGDNCGEALFDRLFIEEIHTAWPHVNIFYAARSAPIINDVLVSDARRVGIGNVARVISSGCDYPGLILSKTSQPFKRIYRSADIIISKGQGNFESFRDGRKRIFYLFKVKCPAVSIFLSLPVDSLLFIFNQSRLMKNSH